MFKCVLHEYTTSFFVFITFFHNSFLTIYCSITLNDMQGAAVDSDYSCFKKGTRRGFAQLPKSLE